MPRTRSHAAPTLQGGGECPSSPSHFSPDSHLPRCVNSQDLSLSPSTLHSSSRPADRHDGEGSSPLLIPSSSPIPRPPNAWILYRSHKIEQLRQEEIRNAQNEHEEENRSPASNRQRRTSSGMLKRGALTAGALAALAGAHSESTPDGPKVGSRQYNHRGRETSPTPSLSSTLAASSSLVQPASISPSGLAPSSSGGLATSANVPISTLLAQMWKAEPESVKSTFQQMAKLKEADHKRTYPGYKYSPRVTEKSMKAREKVKGSRQKKTKKAVDDTLAETQDPFLEIHTGRPSQARKQRFPRPQIAHPLVSGCFPNAGASQRLLSPKREMSKPYPNRLLQNGENRIRDRRRSPRLHDTALTLSTEQNSQGVSASNHMFHAADLAPFGSPCLDEEPFGFPCLDEIMESAAQAVDGVEADDSGQFRHVQPRELASHTPWSDFTLGRPHKVEERRTVLSDNIQPPSSPTAATMGFLFPDEKSDMLCVRADNGFIDDCSFIDHTLEHLHSSIQTKSSDWKDLRLPWDLSFEYVSEQRQDVKHRRSSWGRLPSEDLTVASLQLPDGYSGAMSRPLNVIDDSANVDSRRQSSLPHLVRLLRTESDGVMEASTAKVLDTLLCNEQQAPEILEDASVSLPLDLLEFSFDHRESGLGHIQGDNTDEVAESADSTRDSLPRLLGPRPDGLITSLRLCAEGVDDDVTAGNLHECARPSCETSAESLIWSQQHAELARFLLSEAGQSMINVDVPVIPTATYHQEAVMSEPPTEATLLPYVPSPSGCIEPNMTVVRHKPRDGMHEAALTPEHADTKRDTDRNKSLEGTSPSRLMTSSDIEPDSLDSGVPHATTCARTGNLGTGSTTSPYPQRSSGAGGTPQSSCSVATSMLSPTTSSAPIISVSERARRWEAAALGSQQPLRVQAYLSSALSTTETTAAIFSTLDSHRNLPRQLRERTPNPVAGDPDRLDLNGSYTEEELLGILAQRWESRKRL